ncbi:uncharacterized protein [Fopius arisanus]|uniref:Uncharacterized protein n=1 Tax=Fopius arisanus TaxID=64838 RepID=A0A9R1TR77_9HYME|nr:PREDICTED: uncharacterized protein LOC105273243 [Fopius arisanus]
MLGCVSDVLCNRHCLWIIVIINVHLVIGKSISESCWHENGEVVQCRCTGNEQLTLPETFNYKYLTKLAISSCLSVNLQFDSLQHAENIRDLIVENITGSLLLHPMLISRYMRTFVIRNVGQIPEITHEMLTSIMSIEEFIIEDTRIRIFDETFQGINVTNLIFKNVTVDASMGINILANAKSLKIIDTVIRNVTGNFNIGSFESIELVNSMFEFRKPGEMSLHGFKAIINNCTFYNITVNVVTQTKIEMKNNCADGKSLLRLDSKVIKSIGNKSPNEINLPKNTTADIQTHNNTVCIAANCKCPRHFYRNCQTIMNINISLGIILMFISYLL